MYLKFFYSCVGIIFCSLLFISSSIQENPVKIIDLKTEYLEKPIGLDTKEPRFSWKFDNGSFDGQTSYTIYLGTDSSEVANKTGDQWETTFKTDKQFVSYKGKPLRPFTKYYWSVEVRNLPQGNNPKAISSFQTGMMNQDNWKGSWITDSENVDLKPVPYFRKKVAVKKEIKKATVYISAAGLYELYINGKEIGDHRLDPVYTRFDKRNLYVTYDVTRSLQMDENVVGIQLGNGWYNHQSTAVWNFDQAEWRNRPRFILNLLVEYQDGSSETMVTDSTWKTDLSPVIFTSIYTAEHVDHRLNQDGWSSPGFDDSNWKPAMEVPSPSKNIVAQAMQPIRDVEKIAAKSIRKINDTSYIFDFGRNFSGVTELKVHGQKGTELRVTHSEQLDSVGNLDLSNIDVHYRPTDDSDPFQTDIYFLNGDQEEIFKPKFNYKGFQYVQVTSSKPIELNKESITGLFMHSDVEQVGNISSSNEIVNKIWKATNASYLSNLFGYPTDCPQREKNGWTGDAHINIETGLYNYDAITIYEKWMDDHRDEQQPNGVLPSIIPTWGWGYDWGNGPDWTSTIAIIPWELYMFYGDNRALGENYENIKKYVDHITSISDENGLTDWGLGDWVPVKSVTPKELTSSIYYYVDAVILSKAARLFGKNEDYEKYTLLADKIKEAINNKYLDKKSGMYGEGRQTELSAALYWGIVPDEFKNKVAKNLADRVIMDDKHIDVGLLGSKTILGALSENGYSELAYEVASQKTYPSWGWWIVNGATTLYENWNLEASSDISKNHIMFGAIGAWFFKGLGGIYPDENHPGFKHIILKPGIPNNLAEFSASHTGPFGKITSSWQTSDEKLTYTATIPPNSSASLMLKNFEVYDDETGKQLTQDTINLSSGTHVFSLIRKE